MSDQHHGRVEAAFDEAGITPTPADVEALAAALPGLQEMARRLRSVDEAKDEVYELTRDCRL